MSDDCAKSSFGCCDDKKTAKVDSPGTNCAAGGCAGTKYGCCKDGKTSKTDAAGSNCADSSSFWSKYKTIIIGIPVVIAIALIIYFMVIVKKRNNMSIYR